MQPPASPPILPMLETKLNAEQMNSVVQAWIDQIMPAHKPKVLAVKSGTEGNKPIFRIEFAPPETTANATTSSRDTIPAVQSPAIAETGGAVSAGTEAEPVPTGPHPAHSGTSRKKAG